MFPKIVVPPNHPILIGFSIIFTIKFWGSPIFGNTHMFADGLLQPTTNYSGSMINIGLGLVAAQWSPSGCQVQDFRMRLGHCKLFLCPMTSVFVEKKKTSHDWRMDHGTMVRIFTYMNGGISMVNVGKYTILGCYGYDFSPVFPYS